MRTGGHGLSIDVPAGWEARIVRPPHSAPFLHVANFTLHADDGQFGADVTARMPRDGVFASIVEYLPDANLRPDTGLFAGRWRPRLRLAEFGRTRLQVTRAGHLGAQRFFTAHGRPFCLYTVIAPVRRRPAQLTGELSAVLATLRFEPAPSP